MLRRPISTVLSSLSIVSRLSTRVFCASAASTNDQIPTVRTSGSRWLKDGTKHAMNGIYWGEGDPRNTIVQKIETEYDITDLPGTRLRSIMMALEQAQKDGLKQIRVQTDSHVDAKGIRMVARKYKNKSFATVEDKYVAKYCDRILKIMDKIEVIIEYRKPWFQHGHGNEVFALLNGGTRKQNGQSRTVATSHFTVSPTDVFVDERAVPTTYSENTVRTTGILWEKDGLSGTMNGIYWGKGDPRNTSVVKRNDTMDKEGTRLRSILMALEQAQKSGLERVHLQSDSIMNAIGIRKMAQKFKNVDPTSVKDVDYSRAKYCERIVKIMDQIDVTLEFRTPWLNVGNEVMTLLKEDYRDSLTGVKVYSPTGVSSLEGRTVPTAYVRGKRNNFYKSGVSASLWVPESIEHLEINQRPMGMIERLSVDPENHHRAQMMAILKAIKEAQALNLPEIRVITDSLPFVHYFSMDWKTTNGVPVDNEDLYLEIKALTETIKVHFKGVRYTPNCSDELLKKVHQMAKDGLKNSVKD